MKDLLNPWVIAGAILTASILVATSFLTAGWFTLSPSEAYQGGAVITVIPVPTVTPTPLPPPTLVPLISPTPEMVNAIQPGGYVEISGTEGDGLRLRKDPSLNGEIVYVGFEGEIFFVKGGPEDRDGYLWWQLEAPLNPSRLGWAVSNFLEPAQGP